MYIKTYIFKHFYEQYLVLLTMAPRNISTVVCCYRSRTPCKTIPTCTVNTNSNSPSFLSSKGLDVVAALKATGPKFIPLLGCGRLAEQHSSSEENDCQPTRVLSVPHGFLLPSSPSSSSSSSWERDFHVIGFAVLLSGECFFEYSTLKRLLHTVE